MWYTNTDCCLVMSCKACSLDGESCTSHASRHGVSHPRIMYSMSVSECNNCKWRVWCDSYAEHSLLTRFSSPRELGALQQPLNCTLPLFPVLSRQISSPVTCESHRIRIFTYALISRLHRPASPPRALNVHYNGCRSHHIFLCMSLTLQKSAAGIGWHQ